jgi:hypothetical protein
MLLNNYLAEYSPSPLSFQVNFNKVDTFAINPMLSMTLGEVPLPGICDHWLSRSFRCGPISRTLDGISRRKARTRDAANVMSISDAMLQT